MAQAQLDAINYQINATLNEIENNYWSPIKTKANKSIEGRTFNTISMPKNIAQNSLTDLAFGLVGPQQQGERLSEYGNRELQINNIWQKVAATTEEPHLVKDHYAFLDDTHNIKNNPKITEIINLYGEEFNDEYNIAQLFDTDVVTGNNFYDTLSPYPGLTNKGQKPKFIINIPTQVTTARGGLNWKRAEKADVYFIRRGAVVMLHCNEYNTNLGPLDDYITISLMYPNKLNPIPIKNCGQPTHVNHTCRQSPYNINITATPGCIDTPTLTQYIDAHGHHIHKITHPANVASIHIKVHCQTNDNFKLNKMTTTYHYWQLKIKGQYCSAPIRQAINIRPVRGVNKTIKYTPEQQAFIKHSLYNKIGKSTKNFYY
jgi:hypothetical protein